MVTSMPQVHIMPHVLPQVSIHKSPVSAPFPPFPTMVLRSVRFFFFKMLCQCRKMCDIDVLQRYEKCCQKMHLPQAISLWVLENKESSVNPS